MCRGLSEKWIGSGMGNNRRLPVAVLSGFLGAVSLPPRPWILSLPVPPERTSSSHY